MALPPPNSSALFTAPFRNFRRILECNNAVIEKIAEMESALGGEYVFDQAFLRSAVAELGRLVREVVYSLNDLADNRYQPLYERFETIYTHLQDLVSGGPGPYAEQLALPYHLLNRDLDHLVGAKNANLGEIGNYLRLPVPEGFAITAAAYRLFMTKNDLFAQIRAELAGPGSTDERARRIGVLVTEAPVPTELTEVVVDRLDRLFKRLGGKRPLAVRSSAVGEDDVRSFAGQFISVLPVEPNLDAVLTAYRQVLAARFATRALHYLEDEADDIEAVPMAVAVQEYIPARLSGVVYTMDPVAGRKSDHLAVTAIRGAGAALVSGRTDGDRYHLARRHPFAPLASHLTGDTDAPPLDRGTSGLRRGSATADRDLLRRLAETAMFLEKAFERPQDIEWASDRQDKLVILQSRPLDLPRQPPPQPASVAAELRRAILLMEGRGHVAQLGIAAGPVVHVEPDTDPETFPVGGVAVCRYASPQLSTIVRKAAAIITDVGSPTGHLAAIAREYRTPALFGTGTGTAILAHGAEVTVDAEEKRVYAGLVQGLVALQAARDEPYLSTPEVRILRRLLRWTAPINLTDPAADAFRAENCRTFHDIIRFCHEKAVDTLIHLHSSEQMMAGAATRSLQLSLPIKVQLIDLGGGLAPAAAQADDVATLAQVRSRPLQALLDGLLRQESWDQTPAPFDFRDLFSSLSRPLSALTGGPEYSGDNLAIIAENYCNLSLRLGYHFNVVDTYLSDDPDDNYVYFRFVGGFATQEKRLRRATLIGSILSSLHFKVERQGDLVIGKAKMLAPAHLVTVLTRLGELAGFSRQLDVRMADDATVDRFFALFLERTRHSMTPDGEE